MSQLKCLQLGGSYRVMVAVFLTGHTVVRELTKILRGPSLKYCWALAFFHVPRKWLPFLSNLTFLLNPFFNHFNLMALVLTNSDTLRLKNHRNIIILLTTEDEWHDSMMFQMRGRSAQAVSSLSKYVILFQFSVRRRVSLLLANDCGWFPLEG